MAPPKSKHNLLDGARVYLSGPMDFVASRANEKKYGWRVRVSQFLRKCGATVFDPWYKPLIKGLDTYGEEDEKSVDIRNEWEFRSGPKAAKARAHCAETFWPTMHIDLRMVDLSDFLIACCPTNLYSVGTPHEIVVARQQNKPVLFVSPPVEFSAFHKLQQRAKDEPELAELVESLKREIPVRENPAGTPSLWYMALVGSENFFDGFGFAKYHRKFKWGTNAIDEREAARPPSRPLLPFLEKVAKGQYPRKWDSNSQRFENDTDWLLMDLQSKE